jgi:glycosyltransferase involved in cell wall biosynthesis
MGEIALHQEPTEDIMFDSGYITSTESTDEVMVTIICVTYNQEKYIADALESFVRQKANFKFKALVGEDCSTDDTAKIVRDYAERYPDIIVPFIREENMGGIPNFVDLLNRIETPFACICDGDDYFSDVYKLQKQYDYLKDHPELNGVFSQVLYDMHQDILWLKASRNYFRPNKNGEIVFPTCRSTFKKQARYTAADVISYELYLPIGLFIKWDNSIDYKVIRYHGYMEYIYVLITQMGSGKWGFIETPMAVKRQNKGGLTAHEDMDAYFIETRIPIINIMASIHEYFKKNNLSSPQKAIEVVILRDIRIYFDAAKRAAKEDSSKYMELISRLFNPEITLPYPAKFICGVLTSTLADKDRMGKKYSWPGYMLIAREASFMSLIAPFIKYFSKHYLVFHSIKSLKSIPKVLLKKLLLLPYSKIFIRYTPKPILESIKTYADKVIRPNAKIDFSSFAKIENGKKIILIGHENFKYCLYWFNVKYGFTVSHFVSINKDLVSKGSGEIEILGIDSLPSIISKDSVIVISSAQRRYLEFSLNVLKNYGIENCYYFTDLFLNMPKYRFLSYFQRVIRWVRCWFFTKRKGLFYNLVIFKLRSIFRELGISKYYKHFVQIKKLKNSHTGERCFIIATGPSLTVSDVELLQNEITFGVNGIVRIYSETSWRPTYYTCIDEYEFPKIQNRRKSGNEAASFFNDLCTKRAFLTDRLLKIKHENVDTDKIQYIPLSILDHYINPESEIKRYSSNLFHGIYNARTVVNACINIAQYMGFKDIYLIGVDCDFSNVKTYFDGTINRYQKINNKDETLTFDSAMRGYMFEKGMIENYEYIKKETEKRGVKVYNCTRGGKLEVFERRTLEEVLAE